MASGSRPLFTRFGWDGILSQALMPVFYSAMESDMEQNLPRERPEEPELTCMPRYEPMSQETKRHMFRHLREIQDYQRANGLEETGPELGRKMG
jgi:hypothetical protein